MYPIGPGGMAFPMGRTRRQDSPIFWLRSDDQPNGGTTFTDKVNGWTPNNPSSVITHSTAMAYGGSSSTIYFPTTNGSYLEFTNATVGTALNFSTGDFAVQLDIYPTISFTNFDVIIKKATPGSWTAGWLMWESKSGGIGSERENSVGAGAPFATRAYTGYNTLQNDVAWYRLVFQRRAGVFRVYIDGTMKAEFNQALSVDTTNGLVIGGDTGNVNYSIGAYMQDIKIYNKAILS